MFENAGFESTLINRYDKSAALLDLSEPENSCTGSWSSECNLCFKITFEYS